MFFYEWVFPTFQPLVTFTAPKLLLMQEATKTTSIFALCFHCELFIRHKACAYRAVKQLTTMSVMSLLPTSARHCPTNPQSVFSAASSPNINVAATQVFSFYCYLINWLLFLSCSLPVPKMMNQLDQCRYININFAMHIIHREILDTGIWIAITFRWLNHNCFFSRKTNSTNNHKDKNIRQRNTK